MKRLAVAALAIALAAPSVPAQTLLFDPFTNENGGVTIFNYNAFANWNVTGNVDYIANEPSAPCFGGVGAGGCVDLDGTSGPGAMRTKSAFSFVAGQTMRISVAVSGSQRSSASDNFGLDLFFAGGANITSFLGTGGWAFGTTPWNSTVSGHALVTTVGGLSPFSTWTFEFLAGGAGTVEYQLSTSSSDNVGPVIDDVLIERFNAQTVVPEPSTYAMLALGLGAAGLVSRRRRRI